MPRSLLTLLIAGASIASLASAAVKPSDPPSAPGFTYIRSLAGIDEYRLDANGLQVLLKRDASVPVVTFNVTYHVGSRNEVTGTTGATHILEHMMFKGSEHFNDPAGNSVKQFLEQVGGVYNATTWNDRTNYFATVGPESLGGYVSIEADRMRHLWLHEADRQAEMTVVRNEFERGKNDPDERLAEEVTAAAYQALPYQHPTIGWKSDIEHVPIEKLREFYDTFYWPDNATAVVVGDFEPQKTLSLIRDAYGSIPRAPKPIPVIYTEEPEQTGARRVTVKGSGELGSVLIAHKTPPAGAADTAALEVLDAILSTGKTSRLYRALIDKGLATQAEANNSDSHDLSLHTVSLSLAPGATPEQAEKAALAEVERIKASGVTPEEVTRAQRQLHAELIYQRDSSSRITAALNEAIAAGDWTLYARLPEAIARVTAADVQRVAQTYLNEDQSTTGWYVPKVQK